MRQILQDMSKGDTRITEAPAPMVKPGYLLIHTTTSLISSGTERMLVDFGKASYLQKVRKQPEKVQMVREKIATDGLFTTIAAVKSKLAQPLPLGYCNVGVVAEVGEGVENFKIGDRVVSNGPHADVVVVAKNLCAHIPEEVTDESAAFVILASIGLQGIRLAKPTLGETFVVTGVGLIGLLTVQLLIAHGCRVLAIDFDETKLSLAKEFGADICQIQHGKDPVAAGMAFSKGRGVDGIIITASTDSTDPIQQAARMSRKRGRIILVGTTGLTLNRSDFYEKELSLQVSCSYGPGRYDLAYEEKGEDYPFGLVRWTQQRNFQAILDMLARKKMVVTPLISHRFSFDDATKAYAELTENKSALAIIIHYSSDVYSRMQRNITLVPDHHFNHQQPIISFIGAGNYASRVLIPAFKKSNAQLHSILSVSGISSIVHGKRGGFTNAVTKLSDVLANQEVNTVAVVTRHNTHADMTIKVLSAGKHVFVEKPLAIDLESLAQVKQCYLDQHSSGTGPQLMVGFNRRFAPHIIKMKSLLESLSEPKSFIITINAGEIPQSHWTQQRDISGGRLIGEACHFIDLMRFLASSPISKVQATTMGHTQTTTEEDKVSITLNFKDGSFGTIIYLANGASSYPKERIEVFCAGRILQLNNFRKLRGYGWPDFKTISLWKQNKGQNNCVNAFLNAIQTGVPAIPIDEIFEVSRVTINIALMLRASE